MRLKPLAFLTLLLCVHLQAKLAVVQAGKPMTAMFISQEALPGEKAALEELSTYFRKISGATVPVTKDVNAAGIVLGTIDSPFVPKEIGRSFKGKSDESFVLKSVGTRVFIVGATQVGTYFGAVTLLSDYLNVRWFYPGEEGEYVKRSSDIALPKLDRLEEPAFRWRLLSQTSRGGKAIAGHTWAARNRLQAPPAFTTGPLTAGDTKEFYDARLIDGIATQGGHLTYYNAAPPAKYLDSHPEYFALVNGQRTRNKQHNDTHHCISNPDLQNLVVNSICDLYTTHGKRISFLFGGPDNVKGWCECDSCRALDLNGTFDVSHRFHTVAQSIAKRVFERCPDAQLQTWAYANYRSIPQNVSIDPRMVVYFCSHGRCFAHALDDTTCQRNVAMLKLIRQWLELNPRMHLYEYAHCTPMHWTPLENTLAHDLRLYKQMGILGWKEEVIFPDADWSGKIPLLDEDPTHGAHRLGQAWLYLNVAARLTWNPNLELDAVIADLESKYYGKAYRVMKSFHELRRAAWDNCQGCFGYPTGDDRTAKLLTKEGLKEKLLALLDQADTLADTPVLKERLHRDRVYLQHYWIKPNEVYRERESAILTAPTPASPIVIDGKDNDAAWTGACYISDFKSIKQDAAPLPPQLKTTVGIMADDANFYFLVQAHEPHPERIKASATKDGPLWSDDSIEIFLDPMNTANAYYQIIINTKGVVYDARQGGNDTSVDFGVKAAATVKKDQYTLEIKVPVKKMEGIFGGGCNWKIQIARNRKVQDDLPRGCFTLSGALPHLRNDYRTICIGRPLLQNGDFMQTDPKNSAKPLAWSLNDACKYRAPGTPQASIVLKPGGQLYQLLWDWKGPLGQSDAPRAIRVLFRASGSGSLRVFGTRYHDNWNSGKLQRQNFPNVPFGTFELNKQPRTYEVRYTIEPDQWIGLFFSQTKGNAVIENVAILFQ